MSAAPNLRVLVVDDMPSIHEDFRKVLVPELNTGQLALLLRSELLIDVAPFTKVEGQPFKVSEISAAIAANLE